VVALEDGPCGAGAAAAAAHPSVVVGRAAAVATAGGAGTMNLATEDVAIVNAAMAGAPAGAGRATTIRSSLDEVTWEMLAALAGEPVETAR
jgi:hypothetical protein